MINDQSVEKITRDIIETNIYDYHIHIIGQSNIDRTWLNPNMVSWKYPVQKTKSLFFMHYSGIQDISQADQQYLARLLRLTYPIKKGKFFIMGMDFFVDINGKIDKKKSHFYISNDHILKLCKTYPETFAPVISVHPHRKNATALLEKYAENGVRYVKWLPNAQGIDPSSANLIPFYKTMEKYKMVLITHTGKEMAVKSSAMQELGNPLRLRNALDLGVKVVMAHCASSGSSYDLDRCGKRVSNFDLFMRLMDSPNYEGLLFGDISGITQINRLGKPLATLLQRTDLHHRLINGSDYPVPAVNILISTSALMVQGYLDKQKKKNLEIIYQKNPLLFDYALKQCVRHPRTGQPFSKSIFLKSSELP